MSQHRRVARRQLGDEDELKQINKMTKEDGTSPLKSEE